jgi:hypothetical protein
MNLNHPYLIWIVSILVVLMLNKLSIFKKGVVEDENVLILEGESLLDIYSLKDILTFGLIFPSFFATSLLSLNFKKTGNKKRIFGVQLFGILYTMFQFWIVFHYYPWLDTALTWGFILHFLELQVPVVIILLLFWGIYIDKDVKYRAKPTGILFLFGVIMTLGFIELIGVLFPNFHF